MPFWSTLTARKPGAAEQIRAVNKTARPGLKGLRVPLPLLFFFLMAIVGISVFDILSQSQDVHEKANKRVAMIVLNGTLKQAHMNLQSYATRLAVQEFAEQADLTALSSESIRTESTSSADRILVVYLDRELRPVKGRAGAGELDADALLRLAGQLSAQAARSPGDDGAEAERLRLVTLGETRYVISSPVSIAKVNADPSASLVVIGLPFEDLVLRELEKYEIFRSGSLRTYLEKSRSEGFRSIAELVYTLQAEDYEAFHLKSVSQIFFVLIAFVICVMIGHHIDEKNDALNKSVGKLTKQEEEAQRLRLLAEQASESKSRFITNMSHELRTPLNAILGYAEMLKGEISADRPGDRRRGIEYADSIYAGGKRLLEQISQILDFSNMASGDVELREELIDVHGLVEEVAESLSCRAKKKSIEIEHSIAANLPQLRADRFMVREILRHLLSNAIKFSYRSKTVTIGVELRRKGELRVFIKDQGMGISTDALAELRKPFNQGQSVYTRNHQGLGLGLPLAKAYADLHGADIAIQSAPEQGTLVEITFPKTSLEMVRAA